MPNYPKFEERLRNNVIDPAMRQTQKPGYAVVMSFDPVKNTCDLVTAQAGSDQMGEVLTNIPAPFQAGLQTTAPKPGTMCWIAYRDGTTADPYITHFFDVKFTENNYQQQYTARNNLPRFMVGM